ncbi:hypothetical protein [Aliarcobacter thereius]|uniref:hypothetical protein n=1 Tax=Aliarcobacter thereius TaxID=544718 RepID=UPI000826504D|nr:hypothetical protein [Aliarcobacter thereius]OCL94137.1 hypothetical protein AAX25_00468 [Aliarcobacter thereius]
MLKKIFILFALVGNLFAHDELILEIVDNKNNTITIIGNEEHNQGLAGALIRIESLISGDVLFKQRLPKESKLTIDIPKEPYQVVLDAEFEVLVEKGIAPLEGFKKEHMIKADEVLAKLTKEKHDEHEWDTLTIIFFVLALLLFLFTIFLSNKNTNKIIENIRK